MLPFRKSYISVTKLSENDYLPEIHAYICQITETFIIKNTIDF